MIKAYEDLTKRKLTETGVWLDPSGLLGASPDALVGNDICLEIKCPYSQRNATKLDLFLAKNAFLEKLYYHQVQGEMFLSGRSVCHFVVGCPKLMVICTVNRDDEWQQNLHKLKIFYKEYLFMKLLE